MSERKKLEFLLKAAAGEETLGKSAATMLAVAMGIHIVSHHPLDSGDLGRCIKIVQMFPEIEDSFEALKNLPHWESIIENWGKLVKEMRSLNGTYAYLNNGELIRT